MERRSEEMIFIRVIACLSIVLLHAVEEFKKRVADLGNYTPFAESAVLLLKFGTPAFVFISIFLIALNYKRALPANFFGKRLQYIFIPYVTMAFFFGVVFYLFGNESRSIKSYTFHNLFLGGYHGYFILIIFQFFALYWLWTKYPIGYKKLLFFSFAINIAYLAVFNFMEPPKFLPRADLIWQRISWIPFPGWIAYFAVAVWMGNHYDRVSALIQKYKAAVLAAPVLTGALVVFLYRDEIITVNSSKRIDMIFFALSMVLALLYLFKDRKASRLWLTINNYSFSIYFLHVFYLVVLGELCGYLKLTSLAMIPVNFALSTALSIVTSWLLNKFPAGKYIVGRVNQMPRGTANQTVSSRYRSA